MPTLRLVPSALAVCIVLASGFTLAQEHTSHGHTATVPEGANGMPVEAAFRAAMDRMMAGMETPLTGNADRDFAVAMIPHHRGAIDMAQALLRHGHDPELRKLADDIVAAQEREIAVLKDWLSRNP